MTRQGTLAYYLAAWVIGCPVVALLVWLTASWKSGSASSSLLLEYCFFALMSGVLHVLLFAFILRRAMRPLAARNLALWSLAGAVLSLGLVAYVVWLGDRVAASIHHGMGDLIYSLFLAGPAAVWSWGWWQAPVDGAAVAAVLCLIDRAFNSGAAEATAAPPAEGKATQAGQSPA